MHQGNGFNGCVNPVPFFNGQYAQDIPKDLSYIQLLFNAATAMFKAKYPSA